MLDMLFDAAENMKEVFGKEIPSRDEWKRPKMGFKPAEALTFVVHNEPILFYAPMKGSPSFVANEARSEVYFPAMGGYKKKYDKITNGLDGRNSKLIKATAEIEVNRTMPVEGNIEDRWERTSIGWEKKNRDERMKVLIEEARKQFAILMKQDKKYESY